LAACVDSRRTTTGLSSSQAREAACFVEGLFASFEVGAVSSQTPAFSSGYQLATSLGWQWRHVVISVRHISNGGLRQPNFGETMLLAGVSF